jgi:diadenosine tetraphosphate (Ap4A) HIT family hydrolase
MKLLETEKTLAFLDINPLSRGHAVRRTCFTCFYVDANFMSIQLVIPKHHGAKLTDIPDDSLSELLPVAAKLARATGAEQYNILQNNGRMAHQLVDHVHVHMIPKPNESEGLGISWPQQNPGKESLQKLLEELKARL